MKTGANNGLRIHREAAVSGAAAELLRALSALLGFFALGLPLACLFRPAEMESLLPAAGTGAVLCLVMAGFRRLGWERYGTAGALLCLAAFTAAFLPKMTDGACLCWNAWCGARTAATGELHLGRTVALSATEHAGCAMLFSLACAWALALLCHGLASRWRTGMVLLSAALTALVLFGLAPEQLSAAAGMGALCAAVLQTLSLWGSGRQKTAPPAALAALGLAVAVAAAAAVSAAIPALRGGEGFLALRSSVQQRLHASRYERGDDGLPEGDLTVLAGRTRSEKTMLTVSMERAEPLYLRGFTGACFTGRGWESLSNETLAENASLLYWLHMGGFYPQTQTGAAVAALGGQEETNRVTVTNLAACSRYAYAPYSAAAGSFALETPLLRLAESSVLTRSGSDRTAAFSTIFQASSKTGDWVRRLNGAEEQTERYLALESGYRRFVEEHYLAIPEETRQLLSPYLDALAEARGGSEGMDAYLAVQCAKELLEQNLRYSEEGGVLPEGENFVSHTLETGTGYDFHYATLGVLALRYYGVPARYAEGYIVTEQLAAEAAQGAADIGIDCAHAWVEVYQEGIGWLPLELTPDYTGIMGAAPQAGQLGAAISERSDPESGIGTEAGDGPGAYLRDGAEYVAEPEQNAEDAENDGDTPDQAKTPQTLAQRLWRALLMALAAILLLAAVLVALLAVRRSRILRGRREQFEAENAADAICWRFAYCIRLLQRLGLDRGCGSALALAEGAAERLGAEYGEQFTRMALLNREALFSGHEMTRAQCGEMAELCGKTAALLRQQSGPVRRLRMKWIECLY